MARDRTSTAPLPPGDPHADLTGVVTTALSGRELLTHPFYRRWEAGELTAGELARVRRPLPGVRSRAPGRAHRGGRPAARPRARPTPPRWWTRNLADELGRPEPHLALFDRFAAALGEDRHGDRARVRRPRRWSTPTSSCVADGPGRALWPGWPPTRPRRRPSPSSKADGSAPLVRDGRGRHRVLGRPRRMDADHGDWAVDALARLGADPDEVGDGRPAGRRRVVGAARRARGRGARPQPSALCPTTETNETISPG